MTATVTPAAVSPAPGRPVRYRPSWLSKLYGLLDELAGMGMVVYLTSPDELRRVWPSRRRGRVLVAGRHTPRGRPIIQVNRQALESARRNGDERLSRLLYAALDRVSEGVLAAEDEGQPVCCAV